MKTHTLLSIGLALVFMLPWSNDAAAQCGGNPYSVTSNQEWQVNPALTLVLMDADHKWYRFPIVRERQYFRFTDVNLGGVHPLDYLVIQSPDPDCWNVTGASVISTGDLSGDDELYAEVFTVGPYYGWIGFTRHSIDDNFKFAVMYGDPENSTENDISVQAFDDTGYENASTLAQPEDANTGTVAVWFNFSVASEGAFYIKSSSPIPGYLTFVALHHSDYTPVASGVVDYYAPCISQSYLLTPGSYKIRVSTPLNAAPGFAHVGLHGPPADTPNDRMVNAITVSPSNFGSCNFTHGKIKRASHSPQITACTNEYSSTFPFSEDIWYKFTATQSQYYFSIKNIVDNMGQLVNIKMSVLNNDGTSTVGLSCEQFFPNGAVEAISTVTGLTPGNQYLLRLGGWDNGNCGDVIDAEFDFCLARPDCIANDDCATAIPFTAPQPGQDATLSGSTLCATYSTSGDCSSAPEQDAWWSFIATQTSYDFTLTAFNGVFSNAGGIELEINSDCSGTTVPGSCQEFGLNQTVSVSGLTIGQTYYLRLNGGGLSEATFSLLIHAPLLSAEDECSGSSMLSVGSACDFQNISTEYASQSPEGTCGNGNNDDVWYNFTATSPVIKFSVANIVATQGSVSYIYFGIYESCGGALVACFALGESGEHIVNTLSAGQAYKLQMFTFGANNKGTFDVCLQSITPVSNDDCANAIAVSPQLYNAANPTPFAVNTLGASLGVNDCDGNPADDELWYSFTAISTSYLFKQTNFIANSGTFNGLDYVRIEFFETCGGASVGCYTLLPNYARAVVFTIGQSYSYRVWTESGQFTATFDLLQLQLPNTPSNDYCDAPIPVTVVAFDDPCNTVAGSTLGGTYSNDSDCGTSSWDDVFFSFTADYANIAIYVDNFTQLWGQSTGLHLLLFDACLSSYVGSCTYLSEGESVLYGNLTIGQTYYLKVSSLNCGECYTSFDLCIKEGGPPNDPPNFNYQFNLNNGAPISGSTVNASYDAAFGLPSCVTPGTPIQDVWYFLENYNGVNGEVSISNASNDIKSAIYKGNINDPAALGIIAATCGAGNRTIPLYGMETSQFYWLRVWTENGVEGTFEVQFEDVTSATAQIALPTPNNCTPTTSVTVNSTNLGAGIPVMQGNDPVLVIYPNGNNLGLITVDFYTTTTQRFDNNNVPYLNRNIAITPENQPTPGNPVTLSFLLTATELAALGIPVGNLNVTRVNSQSCAAAVAGMGNALLPQSYSDAWLDGYYINAYTDHFSSFYAHGGNQPLSGNALPVELLDFQGHSQGKKVVLKWQTASEINSAWNHIERSADGRQWQPIGKMAAQGNSAQRHDYAFDDSNPLPFAYYRLRLEDLDGSFSFSKTIALQREGGSEMLVYLFPNPAAESLTLELFFPSETNLSLRITDVTGRLVLTEQFRVTEGSFTKMLDVSGLQAGFYFLEIKDGERREVRRVVRR